MDVKALKNGQIDGYVVDFPTAYVDVLIKSAERGRRGAVPGRGRGLRAVFEDGSTLVDCVNIAIGEMDADGTLAALRSSGWGT